MPARSLIVLYGPARYQFEHSVLRDDINHRRVCIAYREFTTFYLPDGEKYDGAGEDVLNKAKMYWDHSTREGGVGIRKWIDRNKCYCSELNVKIVFLFMSSVYARGVGVNTENFPMCSISTAQVTRVPGISTQKCSGQGGFPQNDLFLYKNQNIFLLTRAVATTARK